jgi:hypothetical protein
LRNQFCLKVPELEELKKLRKISVRTTGAPIEIRTKHLRKHVWPIVSEEALLISGCPISLFELTEETANRTSVLFKVRHERRLPSFGRFCASTVTWPREPISFRELVYKVFSYFKREADASFFLSVCAPTAFVRVGHFSRLKDGIDLSLFTDLSRNFFIDDVVLLSCNAVWTHR